MKRIYQLVAVAAVTLLLPIAMSQPVAAAFVCEVGFTGPNSENMCVSKEAYTCSVANENIVTITNSTNQEVVSGAALVGGNSTGGSAVSGTVTNTSGTTFNVTVTNSNPQTQEPGTCLASVSVPATEEPKPEEPGRGEAVTPVQPAKAATPAALPVTSGGKAPIIVSVGSLAVVVAGAYAYRRLLS